MDRHFGFKTFLKLADKRPEYLTIIEEQHSKRNRSNISKVPTQDHLYKVYVFGMGNSYHLSTISQE